MLSFWHIVIILAVVILLFGPSRLEKLGPSLGKAIRGFKKGIETGEDLDDEEDVEAKKPKQLANGKKKKAVKKTKTTEDA